MDFVTAAANLRMHIFSMNMKSRFDVKCKFYYQISGSGFLWGWNVRQNFVLMLFKLRLYTSTLTQVNFFSAMAGNIIPAIATTNAIIAGLIVLEGLKILSGELESCRTVSSSAIKCSWWTVELQKALLFDGDKFGSSCFFVLFFSELSNERETIQELVF